MKTMIVVGALVIVLLMSWNAYSGCVSTCEWRNILLEWPECLCESLLWHVCGGTGVLRVSYECWDELLQCTQGQLCVYTGDYEDSFLLIEARPKCRSTHEEAPWCDSDEQCEIESFMYPKWIKELICECLTP